MLSRGEPYRDLEGDYFDSRRKENKVNSLTKQIGEASLYGST